MNEKILIREDKNGTKYYHNRCTCAKCSGTGMIDYYRPVNGGVCFDCDGAGWKRFPEEGDDHYYYTIEKAEKALKAKKSTSEHVGSVGDKLTVTVIYKHTASWENGYGGYWNQSVTNLHTFEDLAGNVYIWKTGNYIEADYGTKMTLKGTVKEHSEYNGIKQTVMTRCKITA